MMQWLEKMTRTKTKVHSVSEEKAERKRGHASAMRTAAAVQLSMQLFLWVSFGGYDRAVQAVWQSALLILLALAVLWLVWRKGAAGLAARMGRYLPLMLLPCLLGDAALLLYALTGLIDSLIPEYPFAVGAAAVAAVCWITLWLSRENGVGYGISALKYVLLLFFLLGTVLLNSSKRADRLWPLMGQGFGNVLHTALLGSGAVWGAALLFVLPGQTEDSVKTSVWAVIPWVLGVIWALWHGFLRPWTPGDALSSGERVMGLARHASGVINYQLAGLMWLAGGPAALCANALCGEKIIRRAVPKCPRALADAAVLGPVLLLVVFLTPRLPEWFTKVLPWRGALSLLTALALWLAARKEGLH